MNTQLSNADSTVIVEHNTSSTTVPKIVNFPAASGGAHTVSSMKGRIFTIKIHASTSTQSVYLSAMSTNSTTNFVLDAIVEYPSTGALIGTPNITVSITSPVSGNYAFPVANLILLSVPARGVCYTYQSDGSAWRIINAF